MMAAKTLQERMDDFLDRALREYLLDESSGGTASHNGHLSEAVRAYRAEIQHVRNLLTPKAQMYVLMEDQVEKLQEEYAASLKEYSLVLDPVLALPEKQVYVKDPRVWMVVGQWVHANQKFLRAQWTGFVFAVLEGTGLGYVVGENEPDARWVYIGVFVVVFMILQGIASSHAKTHRQNPIFGFGFMVLYVLAATGVAWAFSNLMGFGEDVGEGGGFPILKYILPMVAFFFSVIIMVQKYNKPHSNYDEAAWQYEKRDPSVIPHPDLVREQRLHQSIRALSKCEFTRDQNLHLAEKIVNAHKRRLLKAKRRTMASFWTMFKRW